MNPDTTYPTTIPFHQYHALYTQATHVQRLYAIALARVDTLQRQVHEATLVAQANISHSNTRPKRRYKDITCPATGCTHTFKSNNRSHLRSCDLYKQQFPTPTNASTPSTPSSVAHTVTPACPSRNDNNNDTELATPTPYRRVTRSARQKDKASMVPSLCLRTRGLHPVIHKHGFMIMKGVLLYNRDDLKVVLDALRPILHGTSQEVKVVPCGVHTPNHTSRIHLRVRPNRIATFPEEDRQAVWATRDQPHEFAKALANIERVVAAHLGRTDMPGEIQALLNHPHTPPQKFHMDHLGVVWEAVMVVLNDTGYQSSTLFLDYEFMAPEDGTTQWMTKVPTAYWDSKTSFTHTKVQVQLGDAIAFCTAKVHAGPGCESVTTGRYTLFMSWPVTDMAMVADTDEIVVTHDVWMAHLNDM